MRKIRRFNGTEGSEISDENLNKLRQDQTERMARLLRGESGNAPAAASAAESETPAETPAEAPAATVEVPAAKSEGFGPAFSKARAKFLDGGPSTFLWRGTRYGTDLAKPSTSTSPSSSPSVSNRGSGSGSGGGRGPTAQQVEEDQSEKELKEIKRSDSALLKRFSEAESSRLKEEAYQQANLKSKSPEGKAQRAAMEKSQALENYSPELEVAGGLGSLGIKAAAKLVKNLMGQGAKKVAKRVDPTFREKELEILKDIPRSLPGSKKLALPAPPKRLGYSQVGAKRGGAVKTYASGGSVSASRRGDGIAQRGKTRGKMC